MEGRGRTAVPAGTVRYGTSAGRWVIAATALGSGIAFLDGTVVNVALHTIDMDMHAGVTGLQWTIDAYLVTLTALLLLGGSLGDRFGRRMMFVTGLAAFTAASVLCGLAPNITGLIAARALQGVGGALLVPGSLAIISASFDSADRNPAVGAWAGLTGVATALGPFIGGWLIEAGSWRLIFFINVPLAAIAMYIVLRHVPESRDDTALPPDVPGAVTATTGLATVSYALITWPSGAVPVTVATALAGAALLVAFVLVERSSSHPMLPLGVFASRQFTGANLTTLAVYAGLGGALFLVILRLQVSLGYAALAAGVSLLPVTVLMLLLSPTMGRVAQRFGPRLPLTVGPLVAGLGLLMFARVKPGATYLNAVLPAALVFGIGLTTTVAPLTAAVLASVEPRHVGLGSAVNNGAARLAGLLAVAILPGVTGIEAGGAAATTLAHGFPLAMQICASVCALGGVTAFLTIRRTTAVQPHLQAEPFQPCHDPCVEVSARQDAAARS